MTRRHLDELSRAELIRALEQTEALAGEAAASESAPDRERLIHDLEVHQIELEMQNRELRDAQARLAETSDKYRELYDFAPVGYCTLDPEGRIADINLTGAALLGAQRDELSGRSFAGFLPRESRPVFSAHIARCREQRARVTSELLLARGRPGLRIAQIVSEPMWDADGHAIGFRTSLVDISTLKELEQDLVLLSHAGEILAASMDRAGILESVSRIAVPALADMCFIDVVGVDGLIERALIAFADPGKAALTERFRAIADRRGWQSPQTRVIASGEPILLAEVSAEARDRIAYDDRDAATLLAAGIHSLMVVPLHAHGRAIGAMTLASAESAKRYATSDLVLARELATRVALALDNVRLYAAARQATAARDATLAVVAHDMRTPVQTILMGASMLLNLSDEQRQRTERDRSLASMYRSAERLNRMIRDLVDISSIEAGRFSVDISPHSVVELVEESIEALRAAAEAKPLRLDCQLPVEIGALEVECDRDRIEQVLANLIGNAIKFAPPGSAIVVRAELRGDEVRISVADRGPGIAAAQLPHVFDRYWQAPETARLGHGLGLAIAKGIVEAHEGRLGVDSEVGVGTTFYFTLPLASGARRRPGEKADNTILVVDDESETRDLLAERLALEGYEVATASNGAEALAYLHRAAPPRVVLLDLAMPVMNGWEFLAERERDPALRSIRVVVVSGQDDVADRVAKHHADFLMKPVTAERLFNEVAHTHE